jgi:hypothetical protein
LWKIEKNRADIFSNEDEDDDETSPFRMFFPMDAVGESNASWNNRIEDWLGTTQEEEYGPYLVPVFNQLGSELMNALAQDNHTCASLQVLIENYNSTTWVPICFFTWRKI